MLVIHKKIFRIGRTVSDALPIYLGVHQGSNLVCLMFILYINELPECSKSASFGYANDHKIASINLVMIKVDSKRILNWRIENFMM